LSPHQVLTPLVTYDALTPWPLAAPGTRRRNDTVQVQPWISYSKHPVMCEIGFWYGSALWYDQTKSYLDFSIKFSTIQFYAIEHNSKSNCLIELKLYHTIPEVFVYVGENFQMNRRSLRACDIGQNRLYEFCYLFYFDSWTSYLKRIFFVKGCGSLMRTSWSCGHATHMQRH